MSGAQPVLGLEKNKIRLSDESSFAFITATVTSTGSHQKTSVFGTIAMDGRQFFRKYYAFNQYFAFLKYLKQLERKFGRLILFIDRASQHYRPIKVKKHLEEHHDVIRIEYFPKGSPEFNAVEECWRQGKHDLLVSKYYPRFTYLKLTCLLLLIALMIDSITLDYITFPAI